MNTNERRMNETTTENVIESWEALLTADDTEYTTVLVGGKHVVRLGSLNAATLLQWLESQRDPEQAKTNGLDLVVKSLVNSKGDRIGVPDRMLDLQQKQPGTMKRLIKAAQTLNGLDAVPNEPSVGATLDASRTDSPSS